MAIKGYWKLNGNSNDYSGNGNNGTDTNISYSQANGKLNQGAGFVKASLSKIVIADNAALEPANDMSISLWVKFSAILSISGSVMLFNKDLVTANRQYALYYTYNDVVHKLSFYTFRTTGFNWAEIVFTPTANKWYFVTATYNSTTHAIKMYLDGKEFSVTYNSTNGVGTLATGTAELSMGYRNYSGDFAYLSGALDEVKLEDTLISPAIIKNDYSRVKGFF